MDNERDYNSFPVTISREEYRELLKNMTTLTLLRRYAAAEEYMNDEYVRLLLDVEYVGKEG